MTNKQSSTNNSEADAGNHPPAPLWRRLFAMVYDTLLLFGIVMLFGFTYVLSKKMILGVENFDESSTAAGDPLMFVLLLGVIYGFFYWFWSHNGQTLGMKSWRLQIVNNDGSAITAKQALIRYILAPFSMTCAGLGFLWCLFGPKKTWHDIASQSQIVLLPKEKK